MRSSSFAFASATGAVLFDEGEGVHHSAKAAARAERIGFGFGVERAAPGRKLGRIEGAARGVKNPNVFVVAFVRVGGGDHRSVNGGERSPVRKSIVVGMNGVGHGDVIERHVVRKDDHEI